MDAKTAGSSSEVRAAIVTLVMPSQGSAIMSGRLQIIMFIGTHLISSDDRWEAWSYFCRSCRAQVWELILEVFTCVFVSLWW